VIGIRGHGRDFDPLAAIRTAIASGGSPTGAQGDWLSGTTMPTC
jgi:hypothetical protein